MKETLSSARRTRKWLVASLASAILAAAAFLSSFRPWEEKPTRTIDDEAVEPRLEPGPPSPMAGPGSSGNAGSAGKPVGVERVTSEWLERLGNADPKVRADASMALAALAPESPEALHVLLLALRDPSEEARGAAADAASQMARTAPHSRASLLVSLEMITNGDPDMSYAGLEIIREVLTDPVERLIAALRDPDLRHAATGAIVALSDRRKLGYGDENKLPGLEQAALPLLAAGAESGDPAWRLACLRGLTELIRGGAEARGENLASFHNAVLSALVHDDASLRVESLRAMGLLIEELESSSVESEDAGIFGSSPGEAGRAPVPSAISRVQALDIFLRGLSDDDNAVRIASLTALSSFLATIPEDDWRLSGAGSGGSERTELYSRVIAGIAAMGKMIRHSDESVRLAAVESFGRYSLPEFEEFLALAMNDSSSGVRIKAAETLGNYDEIGNIVGAVAGLAGMLHASDSEVRRAAAATLGMIAGKGQDMSGAVSALLASMGDPDPDVRSEVAWALGKAGNASPEVIGALLNGLKDSSSDVRDRSIRSLGQFGEAAEKAVPILAEMLVSGPAGHRMAILDALSGIGVPCPEAVPVAKEIIEFGNEFEKQSAIRALGAVGAGMDSAKNTLLALLDESSSRIREMTLGALLNFGPVDSVPAITAILRMASGLDPERRAAQLVIERTNFEEFLAAYSSSPSRGSLFEESSALQQAGTRIPLISCVPKATTDRLIELARDNNPRLRLLAVLLAGKRLEPFDLESLLTSVVADPETAVRLAAVNMAGESEEKPFARRVLLRALKSEDPATRSSAAFHLWSSGTAYCAFRKTPGDEVQAAIESACDPDAQIRAIAIIALGKAEAVSSPVVRACTDALRDSSPQVREKAAWALSRFGKDASDSVPALMALIDDPHPVASLQAAIAVLTAGAEDPRAYERIASELRNTDQSLREEAIMGLVAIGFDKPGPARLIEEYLASATTLERSDVIRRLGQAGPVALPLLTRCLSSKNEEIASAAAFALSRIGGPAVPTLLGSLADQDPAKRVLAARSLGRMGAGARDAVDSLVNSLRDGHPRVREWAARALGFIGSASKPVVIALEGLAFDPDDDVKEAAKDALSNLAGQKR